MPSFRYNFFPHFCTQMTQQKVGMKLIRENFTRIWPWRGLNCFVCVAVAYGWKKTGEREHGTKSLRAWFVKLTLRLPFKSCIKTADPDVKDKSNKNHAPLSNNGHAKFFRLSMHRRRIKQNVIWCRLGLANLWLKFGSAELKFFKVNFSVLIGAFLRKEDLFKKTPLNFVPCNLCS